MVARFLLIEELIIETQEDFKQIALMLIQLSWKFIITEITSRTEEEVYCGWSNVVNIVRFFLVNKRDIDQLSYIWGEHSEKWIGFPEDEEHLTKKKKWAYLGWRRGELKDISIRSVDKILIRL